MQRTIRFLQCRSISIERIRNVGIIAHIDAGKTTTTERMLYYAGFTQRIGNVDEGSTVTDFLKTERERGITIQSVCIPFGWKGHKVNLIDTPGHVDFTIEVERSLRVLDGSVVILDGVAGVEAQTVKVWNQANNYKIPRMIFINKMDRLGASLSKSMASIQNRLKGWGRPILLQIPFYTKDGTPSYDEAGGFGGVVDLIKMEQVDFSSDPTGIVVTRTPVSDSLREKASEYRSRLIDDLSDVDEEIIETFMETGDALAVPEELLFKSIRKHTIDGSIVPVLCGASFRNVGVQPVLDGVVDFLPSPVDKPSIPVKEPLCALAFKIVHDPKRGPLVFVRVYSGTLDSKSILRISGTTTKERVGKLMEVYADDLEEIPRIEAGNIGCIVGLKHTKTGDTLVSSNDKRDLKLHSIQIPPPVFVRSCSVESNSEEQKLQQVLEQLQREDPSFHVGYNEETGQTILSGMGELHLEIMGERILEHKVNAKLGKVEISYRETCLDSNEFEMVYDTDLFGKQHKCTVIVEISPLDGSVRVGKVDKTMILNGDTQELYQV
jgi:elongation factor G